METRLHNPPSAEEILQAHERIKPFINRTPVMTSGTLNRILDAEVFFKCENFQKVGAFKARGATNAVLSLDEAVISKGVATHSSGNHAQALSWAASLRNIPAFIVMPENSSRVKVDAVKEYGGIIRFCKPTLAAREETLKEVIAETGAIEVHPYNNMNIIAGQATAAKELLDEVSALSLLLAPVGGGGLLSGTALAVHYFSPHTKVIAAEPEKANDAWLSFTRKEFVPSVNPQTIADGLRTSLGSYTFPIILDHVENIVTVSEESIITAMRFTWERMKILVETSSAVTVAALLEHKVDVKGKKVGVVISGGNVDLDDLPWAR
ncbi:MAG: pyridoxal-phosphate dependent enzyme [Bacteroidetes bacterium]|nr:pyridoxal-phosphate dependent enzyme [Bacteroidota bacterium]